jgi:hypothetical protein
VRKAAGLIQAAGLPKETPIMSYRISTVTAVALATALSTPAIALAGNGGSNLPSDYQASRALMHGDASVFSEALDDALFDGNTVALRATGVVVGEGRARPETVDRAGVFLTHNEDDRLMVAPMFDGSGSVGLYVETRVAGNTSSYSIEDGGAILTLDTPSAPETIRFTDEEIHLTWSSPAELATPDTKHRILLDELIIMRSQENKDAESEWAAMTAQGTNYCEGNVISVVDRNGSSRGMRRSGAEAPEVDMRAVFDCVNHNTRNNRALEGAAWVNFDVNRVGRSSDTFSEAIVAAAYGPFIRLRNSDEDVRAEITLSR